MSYAGLVCLILSLVGVMLHPIVGVLFLAAASWLILTGE